MRRRLRNKARKSRPTDKIKRLEGSAVGEAPLVFAVTSETTVLVLRDGVEVVDDEPSGALFCKRRLDAELKIGVRLVEESDVELSEDVVELRRLDEVTVCVGCKVHFGPGH